MAPLLQLAGAIRQERRGDKNLPSMPNRANPHTRSSKSLIWLSTSVPPDLHILLAVAMMTVAQKLEANRRRMKTLLLELTTGEGLCPTALEGVKLARTDHNIPRTPVL